jgi:hypothetical protein
MGCRVGSSQGYAGKECKIKPGRKIPPVDARSSNSWQLSGTDASFSYFNGFGNHIAAVLGADIALSLAGYNLINT